jgi:16S rRNA (adenine1518-N6/adenine1519-N6)-dimethyltransferase
MHFMLQKEVVDRLCADPGNKKYGRLTVMMQYYCEAEILFDVPPESFDPIPKVNSAIVKLIPHQSPPVTIESIEKLNKVVITAFSQRRKTIRNSLKTLLTEQQISALEINPELRAEAITLAEFAKLSHEIEIQM